MASTGDAASWRLGRRPALDGVRGIAILLVLAGHGWVPAHIGGAGKIGVAVFFTLSGFLITSLLLEERARSGRVDYRAFYVRRARRLLPAQLVATTTFVVFASIFGAWWLWPSAAVAAYLYLGNLHPSGLVGHFWSLAVEEQFYLLWPLTLAWLLRRQSRWLPAWLLGAACCSLALRIAVGGTFLFQQSDGLLVGCALAVGMHGRRERTVPAAVPMVACGVLAGLGVLPMAAAETWGMSVAAAVTAVLIWAVVQGSRRRWVEAGWMCWLGRRSYALYLWHYPIGFVLFVGFGITDWLPFVAIVAPLSLALTVLSWRFVETPFLAHSSGGSRVRGDERGDVAAVDGVDRRAGVAA